MIPRYDDKDMAHIWSDAHRFTTFLKVESALLQALENHNRIPAGASEHLEKIKINLERIREIENATHHDVIAFCSSITEQLPPEIGKYFHYGVTSSDIIDTALSIQIRESIDVILPELNKLMDAIKQKALQHKSTLAMGRSHGMHAEPTSFGLKFLSSYAEFKRRRDDLMHFARHELTGQLSGAVGNYTILSPSLEEEALSFIGLGAEPVSTQIIPRDRVAKLIALTSLLAAAITRLATEIRLLNQEDIGEIQEGFHKGQKGSSTMPHKRNPIACENLCGIARILESHLAVALANIPLWHERDISHSSAERIMLPDNLGLLLYAIKRLTRTVYDLDVRVDEIERKVTKGYRYLSSFYLHFLLNHTRDSREQLYDIVQAAAHGSHSGEEFRAELHRHYGVELPCPTIDELKRIYLHHVDEIYNRVLNA